MRTSFHEAFLYMISFVSFTLCIQFQFQKLPNFSRVASQSVSHLVELVEEGEDEARKLLIPIYLICLIWHPLSYSICYYTSNEVNSSKV